MFSEINNLQLRRFNFFFKCESQGNYPYSLPLFTPDYNIVKKYNPRMTTALTIHFHQFNDCQIIL